MPRRLEPDGHSRGVTVGPVRWTVPHGTNGIRPARGHRRRGPGSRRLFVGQRRGPGPAGRGRPYGPRRHRPGAPAPRPRRPAARRLRGCTTPRRPPLPPRGACPRCQLDRWHCPRPSRACSWAGSSSSWLTSTARRTCKQRRPRRAATVTPAEALSGWVQLGGLELDLDRRLLLVRGQHAFRWGCGSSPSSCSLASQHGRVLTRQETSSGPSRGRQRLSRPSTFASARCATSWRQAQPLDQQLVTVYGVGYRWDASQHAQP